MGAVGPRRRPLGARKAGAGTRERVEFGLVSPEFRVPRIPERKSPGGRPPGLSSLGSRF